MARSVGIRELKAEASALVAAAEAGETVVVTRRGREVARLVPRGDGDPGEMPLHEVPGVAWSGERAVLPETVRLDGDGPGAADTVLADRDRA